MTQYVINTGAFPNDGTGDPLRTAFEYVNLNFDQIFNAGPVLSNIEIINNSIITTNTNGNLILNPNGIGNIIGNAHVIPDTDSIRNLGAIQYRWDTVYARYYVGDGNGLSNISANSISNGNTRMQAYFNGNIAVTANGVANVAVFTVDGLTVPGNVLAGTLSGNVNTTNISGNSITISATGNNQGIVLAPNGTGNVSVSFKNIVNLAEPVNPQDAATKYYVDSTAQGLDIKASCLLATSSALPAYAYNNGTAGFGATITGNAVGALSIDGESATANARVLVKNESGANQPYNGIYVVTNPGSVGNAYVLTRSTDFDNGAPSGEIPGAFTFIEQGSTNADTGWVCTTNNPVTMGTTPITFVQFSGGGSYSAGDGLNLVGTVFNAVVDNDTTEINGSNQIAVKPGANLVTPNIGAATGTSLSLTGALTANSISTGGELSIAGNITGGNLLTTGRVSATSDVIGSNLVASGFITAVGQIVSSSNINGANFNTAGKISATGNVTGGNLVASNSVVAVDVVASGTVSSVGNIVGANLVTTGAVLAGTANITGNIESGNILNTGIVSSAGNVTGGNIRTAGQITATGNLTVGNVRTAGLISAAGDIISNSNIIGANIASAGTITAVGNIISNQYFIGNGAFLSGIDATSIQNGNSNVRVLANANVTVSVSGASNVAVFANNGVYIDGLVSASGNITGANVSTGNLVATGNVSAENVNANTLSGTNVAVNSTGDLALNSTGNITVGNTYITNLRDPVNLQDAATKYYVDTVATGLDPKASVVYATASALGVPYVYANGLDGVGATITATIPGALTIDGNVVQAGQRVLIKNETGAFVSNSVPSAAFNGIYDVTVAGDGSTTFVLTRSDDFDINIEMPSSFTFAEAGATNADTGWVCITNNPVIVGFTQIIFTQFSGAGTYTAGAGLSLAGSVFNALVDNTTTEINGSNQIAVKAGANLVTPNIGAATGTSLSVTGNVTATTFVGNLVGNITGNIDAGGSNTEIQFNDDNILAGSAGFTFDKTSNAVVVTGNVTGTNLISTDSISAVGNIAGANLFSVGVVSASGNVRGGNINTAGAVSAGGNVVGSNIVTSGSVTATGNITADGNVTGGNVATTGTVSATSNVTGGNLTTSGAVSATSTITGGNIATTGTVSATSTITGGNIATTGTVSATGNITSADYIIGSNIFTSGSVTATGNITAEGNLTAGNIETVGTISAVGDITTAGNLTANIVNTETVAGNSVTITASVEGISLLSAGNINVGNTYINDLRDPEQAQDAATKYYVDSVAQGLDIKNSVGLATQTTLPTYTYDNGASGVGATLTGTANGALLIDTTSTVGNERVLVKNESAGNAPYNGIYLVTQTGNATAPYILTRSTDMDTPGEFPSAFTFVEYGNTNADTGWVCTTNAPITIGTTPVVWTQFSGGGTVTAGNGIAIIGTAVNVLTDGITTAINGSNQVEVKPGAQLTTPNIGNATGVSLSVTGNIETNNIVGSNVTITSTGATQNITLDPTGNVDVSTSYINNVIDPVQAQDAATKSYVDTAVGSVTANVLGNLINMGSNTQGQLISNAVTLTTTTKVTDGIALLNQVLGKLVPPAPPTFPGGQTIVISGTSTYRMANIIQVNNTANSLTVPAGASISTVLRAATYATNTVLTTGPGDAGTVTTYRNGVAVGNVTLNPAATPSANGVYGGGNLIIANNFDYNSANSSIAAGFWYVFSAGISGSNAPAGWNDIVIFDTSAGNTNVARWYYDNSAPSAPSYSATTMTAPGSATLLYTSTIPHYTNVNQFTIGTTVANVSGNLYPTSNVMATGTAGGSFAAPASVNYSQTSLGSNIIGSFATASFTTTANVTTGFGGSATGPSMSVNNSYSSGTLTLTTALGNTVLYKSGTATAIDEGNIVITSVGTGSGNAVRIVNPGTGNTPVYTGSEANFNSQSSTLQTYDATVVGSGAQGVLKHDQTNYSVGYLPAGPNLSTGRTGTQYFTFKFVRTDVSKFDITYAGNVAGMWVALPGSVIDSSSSANGWINMATAYAGAGYPGVNAPGNGSDGCALGGTVSLNTTVASTSKTCTFGTVSSSSTASNEIYVRIALTAGQSVTALSLKSASN